MTIGPASSPAPLSGHETRSDWVRLRTLTALRWMAIAGQIAALVVADRAFGVQVPLGACYLVIGISIIANLFSAFVYPENLRLTHAQALRFLLFDLAQLGALLALTGGSHNPFMLLILAPVTISATALDARSTVLVGGLAMALATAMVFFHVPLRLDDGSELVAPPLLSFGAWLAVVIGIAFMGFFAQRVSSESHAMSEALLATQMALAREQKLTDLGGVVAAAAHELGTPLATIKLVATELVDELSDRPDLAEDVALIRDQADRCRDIMRSMGRAGKDDMLLRQAPLEAVVREAADPHLDRGKTVTFRVGAGTTDGPQPQILRRPEIIHGIRNLVQNAVDFARTEVTVDIAWDARDIDLRIIDDGPGFPGHLIGRIGDPFMRTRRGSAADRARPGYEGMGLGLFIAKTLLERTGAEISFANGADPFLIEVEQPARTGAIVEVRWPRAAIEAPEVGALGQNPAF